ncbi:MAG TPA: hypothetical protein VMU28_03050 [Terriglobales bacterium]|nr:hypothetical protein [Terriglobales bacterium]
MRGWLIVALVCLFAAPVYSQSGPEVEALLDAFFAKDLKSLSEHLPPELADIIQGMPADAQAELTERYLVAEQARREGITYTHPDNGAVLRMEVPHRGADGSTLLMDIYLDKRMFDGNEVMLRFRPQAADSRPHWMENRRIVVWMKYVDNDWRVYEIDMDGREIRLDDPNYLAYLKRPRPGPNEESAVGSLRTINTAVVTYSATFPDIGLPDSLENLGSRANDNRDDREPDPDGAGLIDDVLSSPPFQKSGYRFTYNKTSVSEYSVAARPLRYGSDGRKSFFTDQSGVIRETSEDRDATVDDPPLQ